MSRVNVYSRGTPPKTDTYVVWMGTREHGRRVVLAWEAQSQTWRGSLGIVPLDQIAGWIALPEEAPEWL